MRVVDKSKIAENMHAARERAGLTVAQLAESSGVSEWCLYNYESYHARGMPRLDTVLMIADALGITLDDLIGEQVVVDVSL